MDKKKRRVGSPHVSGAEAERDREASDAAPRLPETMGLGGEGLSGRPAGRADARSRAGSAKSPKCGQGQESSGRDSEVPVSPGSPCPRHRAAHVLGRLVPRACCGRPRSCTFQKAVPLLILHVSASRAAWPGRTLVSHSGGGEAPGTSSQGFGGRHLWKQNDRG